MTARRMPYGTGNYSGEIVLVGFTGNAQLIQRFLKKTFGIRCADRFNTQSKVERYCVYVAPEVVAHIETYPWASRAGLKIDKVCFTKEQINHERRLKARHRRELERGI